MKKIVSSLLLGVSLFAASANHTAKVLEKMDSAGYTYMKVDDGKNIYWIAMTQRDVKKGESVSFSEQGWMKDFHSKTLDRTFENILFAGDIVSSQPPKQHMKNKPDVFKSEYKKKGTFTIAELFKDRENFVLQQITVRAKVTKVSQGIMGKNWVHLQDGTSFKNMDDLTLTTTGDVPKEGDIVYATGTLKKDIDFGYGYFYPVIIENTSFKK